MPAAATTAAQPKAAREEAPLAAGVSAPGVVLASGLGSVGVAPLGAPTGAASSSSMASSAPGLSPSKDPTGVCATGVRMVGLASSAAATATPYIFRGSNSGLETSVASKLHVKVVSRLNMF